jgi:organic hydroperoxide reductase OsmC/OhrA
MRLTTMRVTYHLRIPQGKRADAERALAVFERGCPIAQTLKGCVQISHAWEIIEE